MELSSQDTELQEQKSMLSSFSSMQSSMNSSSNDSDLAQFRQGDRVMINQQNKKLSEEGLDNVNLGIGTIKSILNNNFYEVVFHPNGQTGDVVRKLNASELQIHDESIKQVSINVPIDHLPKELQEKAQEEALTKTVQEQAEKIPEKNETRMKEIDQLLANKKKEKQKTKTKTKKKRSNSKSDEIETDSDIVDLDGKSVDELMSDLSSVE